MTTITASPHTRTAHHAGQLNNLQAQGRGFKIASLKARLAGLCILFLGLTGMARAYSSFDSISSPVPRGTNVTASGWAVDTAVVGGVVNPDGPDPVTVGPCDQVKINISSVGDFIITTGGSRPDVQAANLAANPHWSTTDVTNSGWNFSYNIGSLTPGTYTMTAYASRRAYYYDSDTGQHLYNIGFDLIGSKTFTVPSPSTPTGSISADQTNIAVGQSTTIHASFACDTVDGDTISNTNIDQPLGTPVPGSDGSAQTSRSYVFTPSVAGTYTFYARMQTQSFGWNTYGTVNVTVGAPPSITSNPSPVTVLSTQSATFSVTATGTGTLSFQWQRQPAGGTGFSNLSNGGSYSGVTTRTLTVSNTTTNMNGDKFLCVVNNSYAGNPPPQSSSATLTVNPGSSPTIVTPPSFPGTIPYGNGFTLTVGASGSFPLNYQWQISTNGGSSWQNLYYYNYGYTGYDKDTLRYTGVTQEMNGYQYRVIVSNSWPPAATSSATTLNVGPQPPQEPDIPAMPPLALGSFAVLLFAAGRRYIFGKRQKS